MIWRIERAGRGRGCRRGRGASRRILAPIAAGLLLAAPVCPWWGGEGALRSQEIRRDIREIRFDPRPEHPEERQLEAFLERGGYVVLDADTTLGPDSRIDGHLLVLEADVRFEGRVTGDVAAVGADVFLRPGAVVGGDLLSLGGGYYASGRAEVAGTVSWRPNEVYLIRRRDGVIRLHAVRDVPETVTLHGLSGVLFPRYQRVDEWTLGLGATVRNVEWDWQPALEARLRLKTERGDLEGSLRQAWFPTSALTFGVEAERVTRTNEGWVRGDIANSLSFFFAGDDFRNYYEADRVALFLRGTRTAVWSPIVELEWEKARNLSATDQFVLFGSEDGPPNPSIDPGEGAAARIGVQLHRRTTATELRAGALLEAADSTVAGDFTYVRGELRAVWTGPAAPGHEVEAFALVRTDLSGTLPRQRWTAVGGLATLPRQPRLAARGGRFAFGQVTYLIPIERLRFGILGPPRVFLRAATGAAWNPGRAADFDTNLIAGVRLFVFELAVAADPAADDLDPAVYATLRFPGDL